MTAITMPDLLPGEPVRMRYAYDASDPDNFATVLYVGERRTFVRHNGTGEELCWPTGWLVRVVES